MTDKEKQRKELKKNLAALSETDKRLFSRRIAEAAISSDAFFRANRVFVFNSTKDEPDTAPIIKAALAMGKEVYLPRTEGEDMFLIRYKEDAEFFVNDFGIEEPLGEPCFIRPDLTFVPLLGFDKNRNRIGRGKGYYDRFLASFDGDSLALAFSAQELPAIAVNARDKKPNHVITEKGII